MPTCQLYKSTATNILNAVKSLSQIGLIIKKETTPLIKTSVYGKIL